MRKLFYSLLLAAASLPGLAETRIYVEGEEILYNGELTAKANEMVFDLYGQENIKPTTLTITSPGGPIDVGLELGEWVHKRRLDVKVYELCFSSCANYIFPAGRKKLIDKDAVIGFHGGPTSETFDTSSMEAALRGVPKEQRGRLREDIEASFNSYIQINTERESAFYKKLGVSPKLNTLGQSEQYKELSGVFDGWTYTPEDMAILGLANLKIIDDPRPAKLSRKPKVFILKLAPEATLMEPFGLPVFSSRSNSIEPSIINK